MLALAIGVTYMASKGEDDDKSITRYSGGRFSGPDRENRFTLRIVISTAIILLWGAVNVRFFFFHGPEISKEFNGICAFAVAFFFGTAESLLNKIGGKN